MAGKSEFVITRVFNAPRKLVFKAWTEDERLAQWWGPLGCKITVNKLDMQPGGIFHYSMNLPNGNEMWGLFVYREIVEPARIVFISSFSDKDGNITQSPFLNPWPLEILNTLTLTESGGKTTLTITGMPINETEEEYRNFEGMKQSMQQGFGGTFDQLEIYLAQHTN